MRAELVRQARRRRTVWIFTGLVVLPILLALVYVVRGAPELEPGANPQFMHLAGSSAIAFATFVLLLCAPLLLVAVASLLAGDAVASEASWGTLRYLLVAPVTRRALLARKLLAASLLATAATLALVAASLVVGAVAFGWGDVETPVGGTLTAGAAGLRLALATAYVLVTLAPFVAIALLLSTIVEAPLAAVAGAVGVAVVSQILDVIPTLGDARALLPTHYALDWLDLFVDPPDALSLAPGVLQAVLVSLPALAFAWWMFARRDVTS